MRVIWEELENVIQKKYHIAEPEWVQVDVSKRGKIHVTVVTDSNVSRAEIRGIVEKAIQGCKEDYQVGFLDIYSLEKAKELNLEKQVKVKGYSLWSDALYASAGWKETNQELQVISFYSYKGGVGRTIALIETAYNLAVEGKRVLLLDLDIEAPSLHNIFSDQVNDETNGVKYGVIEYLYRKVVQGKTDLSIDHIYCPLQLENVPGEMFLIPALKRMDKEYIYQIGRLQTRKIQEQDIFREIFEHVKAMLDIDAVIIDTRAGFNQWGSLSLFALSDQIIFIAYPNAENIEGLNAALEMVENVGKKRYAVAMSKVITSDEGGERAQNLFEHLKIGQKELIPIYYREEIALSAQYPITAKNILSAYKELSGYILNNEKIERNRAFLSAGKKERLLKNLFIRETKLIRLSDLYKFERQRSFSLLKYRYEEELYGLDTRIERFYVRWENEPVPIRVCMLVNYAMENYYMSVLTSDISDHVQAGVNIILALIENSSVKEQLNLELPEGQVDIGIFMDALHGGTIDEGIAEEGRPERGFHRAVNIIAFIPVTEHMLERDAEKVWENINGLINVFNRSTNEIQFKFMIESKIWDRYQKLFGGMKGNILEPKVGRNDLEYFVISNINYDVFAEYREYIRFSNTESMAMYHIGGRFILERDVIETLGLVLGIRKDVKEYSASIIDYLYRFLQGKPDLRYSQLLDCLKRSADREIEEPDETYTDRLIGFSNLQRELELL